MRDLHDDALKIFNHSLKAANAGHAVNRHLKIVGNRHACSLLVADDCEYELKNYENIYVVGAGKCSGAMGAKLEQILGKRITRGLLIVKYGQKRYLERIDVVEGAHPVPDRVCIDATRKIVELLSTTTSNDLIICLLSGGGSSLLTLPQNGIELEDVKKVTSLFLECGATISEINTVRKHLSRVKGGRLARIAFPSQMITLILSDVIGDPLDVIASGPTAPDPSTFQDCITMFKKYEIEGKIPEPILRYIKTAPEETPKDSDPVFKKVKNIIVGNNRLAIDAAERCASELGYNTLILSSSIEGEAREIAKIHCSIAKEVLNSGNPVKPPACIISGGETTVTLSGKGKGGRNTEFALASALCIDGLDRVAILSGATDGTDGPTDSAGAVVNGETVKRAAKKDIDAKAYLKNNDSYNFFAHIKDLLKTGNTDTNVMDIQLVLVR